MATTQKRPQQNLGNPTWMPSKGLSLTGILDDANDQGSSPFAIYVGGAGDVAVTLVGMADNQNVVFKAVPVGTTLWVRARRVWSTGTTATLMVALLFE